MDLLRHLRFFVTLSEERHYGHAAARLQMSQPPLSQGIRRLETHLGVRLFDRNARGVQLTEGGRMLLPQAEELLEGADQLRIAAETVAPSRPVVRLGIPSDLGGRGATIAGTLRRETGATTTPTSRTNSTTSLEHDVQVTMTSSQALVDLVRAGELDIAVVRHPVVTAGLEVGAVVRLSTRLLLSTDRSEVGDGPVRLADVSDLPLALPPRHHHPAAHDLIVDTLRRHGHPGRTIATDIGEVEVIVATGQAAALTVDYPVDTEPDMGEVAAHPIDGDPLPLRFRVVTQVAARTGQDAVQDWAHLVEGTLREPQPTRGR